MNGNMERKQKSNASKDLVIILVCSVLLLILSSVFDPFGKLMEIKKHEIVPLDKLAIIIMYMALAFWAFYCRRWAELKAELRKYEKVKESPQRINVEPEIKLGDRTEADRGTEGLMATGNQPVAAARDIRRSEARFGAVFERASIGIVLVDVEEGRVIESNPKFCEILGYSDEELRKMSLSDITHPDDVALSICLYRELALKKRHCYQMEKRYVRKDGGIIWGCLNTSLVMDPDGELWFIMGMIVDITEYKRAQ